MATFYIFLLCVTWAHGWEFTLTPETKENLRLMMCKLRHFCLPYKWQVCAHDDYLNSNRIFYNRCYMKQLNACNHTKYFVLDLFEANFVEHPEICERWVYKFRKRENPRQVPYHFPIKLGNRTFYFRR